MRIIYPNELEIKDITESVSSVLYFDILLKMKVYDKRDEFNLSTA